MKQYELDDEVKKDFLSSNHNIILKEDNLNLNIMYEYLNGSLLNLKELLQRFRSITFNINNNEIDKFTNMITSLEVTFIRTFNSLSISFINKQEIFFEWIYLYNEIIESLRLNLGEKISDFINGSISNGDFSEILKQLNDNEIFLKKYLLYLKDTNSARFKVTIESILDKYIDILNREKIIMLVEAGYWDDIFSKYSSMKDLKNVIESIQHIDKLNKILKNMNGIFKNTSDEIITKMEEIYEAAKEEISQNITENDMSFIDLENIKTVDKFTQAFQRNELLFDDYITQLKYYLRNQFVNKMELLKTSYENTENINKRNENAIISSKTLIKFSKISSNINDHQNFIKTGEEYLNTLDRIIIEEIRATLQYFKDDKHLKLEATNTLSLFSSLRSQNNVDFNNAAKGVSFKKALLHLDTNQHLDENHRNRLKKAYKIFEKKFKENLNNISNHEFDENIILNQINECLRKIKNPLKMKRYINEISELLAHLFACLSYLDSDQKFVEVDCLMQPLHTQVLSIFRAIGLDQDMIFQDHLLEILTGEGKSITLGITATLYALFNYEVDVVCYSEQLSIRDYRAFKKLFKFLKIRNKINYTTIENLCMKRFDENNDLKNITLNFLQGNDYVESKRNNDYFDEYIDNDDEIEQDNEYIEVKENDNIKMNPNLKKRGRIIGIDEVDKFFSEDFYGQSLNLMMYLPNTNDFLRYIWDNRTHLIKNWKNNEKTKNDIKKEFNKVLKRYPNLEEFYDLIIQQIFSVLFKFPEKGTIDHKCELITVKKYNKNFQQIGYIDEKTGNINKNEVRGYETQFAYFHYHEQGAIVDKILNENIGIIFYCGKLLYSKLMEFYNIKIGMTGVLKQLTDNENHILNEMGFKRRSYIPSTFIKKYKDNNNNNNNNKRDDIYYGKIPRNDIEVIGGERNDIYYKRIKEEIEEKLLQDRALLVIFQNMNKLNQFVDYIKKKKIDVQYRSYKILSEDIDDYNKKQNIIDIAMRQGQITFMTSTFGRGTDFICKDTILQKSGGAHVLVTYFTTKLVDEIQFAGRTARRDDPGSIKFICLEEDLMNDGFLDKRENDAGDFIPDKKNFNSFKQTNQDNVDNIIWRDYLYQQRINIDDERYQLMQHNLEENQNFYQNTEENIQKIKNGNNKNEIIEFFKNECFPIKIDIPNPKKIMIVLDVSASMNGNPIETCRQSIKNNILDTMNGGDKISLITFNNKVKTIFEDLDTISDRKEIEEKVNNNTGTGHSTALYDAFGKLIESISSISNTNQELDTWVICLTDGEDNSSDYYKHPLDHEENTKYLQYYKKELKDDKRISILESVNNLQLIMIGVGNGVKEDLLNEIVKSSCNGSKYLTATNINDIRKCFQEAMIIIDSVSGFMQK